MRQYKCTQCGNTVLIKCSLTSDSVLCGNGCMNKCDPPGPVIMYESNIPTIEEDLF